MKRLLFAVSAIAFGLNAGAVTYDGKVLSGEWLLNGSEDVVVNGVVSGEGNIRFQQTSGTLTLNCDKTAVGDLYVDWGIAYVNKPEALGTGKVYVNEEATADRWKRVIFAKPMTVTNEFVLGTENTAGWDGRLTAEANVTLSGPLSVNTTKIRSNANCSLVLSGGVTGNKVVFVTQSGSSSVVVKDKPVLLTGTFWVGNVLGAVGGTVVLNVAGNTATGLHGYGVATLKLGVDNPFASPVKFSPQKGAAFGIDLNGHSLDLGSCADEGAGYGSNTCCTVCNTATTGQLPTVSISQVNDNVGVDGYGAAVALDGRMNFTKKGNGSLMPNKLDVKDGTVRVESGLLRLRRAGTPTMFARTVVLAGGTLDLNGGEFSCCRLEQRGGHVKNGKLTVLGENAVYADTLVQATIVGKTVKPAGVNYTYCRTLAASAALPYSYDLPEGTALYMPFDTADTMYFDFGPCCASLYVGAGKPAFASAGKAGGCLYVDGESRVESSGVPAGFPVGSAPVTVSCWVKAEEDCSPRGGWFSYGGTEKGRGSSYSFNAKVTQYKWYANDVDVYSGELQYLPGEWHHVVGVWDGTYRDIYVDGVLSSHTADRPLNTGNSVFMIGKTMWDVEFKGWIDELLVLDHAASAEEVAGLYANGVPRREGTTAELTVESGTLGSKGPLAVAYPFDSAETLLQDASETGATLSNNDGVTYSTESALGTGGSAYFNGSSSFLSLATFPSAIPSGGARRTLLCFVKAATDLTSEGAMISYGNEGWNNGQYLNFAFRGGGTKIGLFPWGAENGGFACTKADVLGKWITVAAVWDGVQVSLYTNGVQALAPTTYQNGIFLNTKAANFKIGKAFYNGNSFFRGNLDEVAVCNCVLSADDLAAYGQGGVSALNGSKPLAANTVLNLAEGAAFSTPLDDQEIAGLTGSGSFAAKSLTLTKELGGSCAVACDLMLDDGIVIRAGEAPTVVTGCATFAGGGTILLPANLPKFGERTILKADTFVGAESFADCEFQNLPKGIAAELKVVNGNELVLKWMKKGFMLICR